MDDLLIVQVECTDDRKHSILAWDGRREDKYGNKLDWDVVPDAGP